MLQRCTQMQMGTSPLIIILKFVFRAHLDYRQNGPWMDWVMIRWDHGENVQWSTEQANECSVHHKDFSFRPFSGYDNFVISIIWLSALDFLYSPAKILCFTSPKPGTIHAIVECCDFKFKRGSIISTEWKKAFIYHGQNHKTPYISYVDAEAIVRHCLVIPDIRDGSKIYHEIWSRDLWGTEFF